MAAKYLGKLCRSGHDAGGGKSLRYMACCSCVQCRKEQTTKWKAENRDRVLKTQRVWNQANFDVQKNRQLINNYGISLEDYRRIHASQGGKCACCKQEESIVGRDLAVDHCHSTGRIRGLLCQACNTAIGKLGDNLDGIEKARFYLLKTLPYAGYSI